MKRIVEHNADWSRQFDEEANRLAGLLGTAASAIHHMGSTAIPDVPAKPIIDILVEATSLDDLDLRSAELQDNGYEARGEYGIAGRRYFKKPAANNAPGVHLHAYLVGSYEIKRHLAFRDYLRLKPVLAEEYARIKKNLCDENGILAAGYQNAKQPFVDRIALEALQFFAQE